MKAPSGFSPLMGLFAALLVLAASTATALTRDDSKSGTTSTSANDVSTRPTLPRSSTGSGKGAGPAPTSTLTTLPATTAPSSTTSTTVKPAVPSPEAAANGLWAAYTNGDRSAAARFATADVVKALFSDESTDPGEFQGCRAHSPGIYDCRYQRPALDYLMAATADSSGSYRITGIQSSVRSTTTTTSTSTTTTTTTTPVTTPVSSASS